MSVLNSIPEGSEGRTLSELFMEWQAAEIARGTWKTSSSEFFVLMPARTGQTHPCFCEIMRHSTRLFILFLAVACHLPAWAQRNARPTSNKWQVMGLDRFFSGGLEVPLEKESTCLSSDGRTINLKYDTLNPVMQMSVHYSLDAADGSLLEEVIDNTINQVP